MILAGDIGGTKILLEAGELEGGRWRPELSRRYESSEVSFAEALANFLDEWGPQRGPRRITSAAFGAAGPRTGNCVKLTWRPWAVDGDQVVSRFKIPRARVVNDLEASAFGIELLGSRDFVTLQPGRAVADAPRVVMGVGTGLGIGYLVPCGGRLVPLAGEGGHMGFAPATPEQAELWRSVQAQRGRVSAEDIVSGTGLPRIYDFVARRGNCPPGPTEALQAEQISAGAVDRADPACTAALDLFVECMASVAADHALAVMARGGVYLVGGVVAKNLPCVRRERFQAAFCAKGAHSAMLRRIPVRAATSERLGVLGAARFAAEG